MSNEALRPEILRAIIDAGFTPYMRDRSHSFAMYTDGTNIGYVEDSYRGISIGTRHKANTITGTGFGIAAGLGLADLTPEMLKSAFAKFPDWRCDESSVVKYRDMADFLASDSWHAGYKPVSASDL